MLRGLRCSLQNGEEYQAKIVGADEETDLAIMKIEAGKDLPFLKFARFGKCASRRLGFGNRFAVRTVANRHRRNYFAN